MEAFAIIVGHIEFDLVRFRHGAEVLDKQMTNAPELGADCPKHRVIGVAGVTGLVRGHQMVLEMTRWNEARIVNIEAAAVVIHDLAGEAEGSRLGAFHLLGDAERRGDNREDKKSHEGQDLAFAGLRHARAKAYEQRERRRRRSE